MGDQNAGDAGFDQRLAAGRRATVMGAGLQGHVGGGAARRGPGPLQGLGLGMRSAAGLGPATPDDLTGMAVFLASSESDYILSQTYNVDGGQWMS